MSTALLVLLILLSGIAMVAVFICIDFFAFKRGSLLALIAAGMMFVFFNGVDELKGLIRDLHQGKMMDVVLASMLLLPVLFLSLAVIGEGVCKLVRRKQG
jgi:hypothetical protein